jgi:hypothetical protein
MLGRLERLSSFRQAGLLFLVAFTLRLSLVILWQIRNPDGVFPDERTYFSQAQAIANGLLASSESSFWAANAVFFRPLVVLAEISDHHALLGRSVMACVGSALAVVVFLLGRQISGRVGLLAGFALALYPSQILWSSMYLKDTLSALVLSTIALAVATATRKGWTSGGIASGLAVPGLVFFASEIRTYSALTAAIAVTIFGLWRLARSAKRKDLVPASLAIAIGVVLVVVLVGDRIPVGGTGGNEALRVREYEDAKTLISCAPIPFIPGPEAYESGWANDLACAPYALRMVLVDPFPNQLDKSRSLIAPLLEQLIWLPLLGLAIGAIRRIRRHSQQLGFPLILITGLVLQWSLIDRVFGTAYRHRTEFVWVVILFAAVCIDQMLKVRTSPPVGEEATNDRAL